MSFSYHAVCFFVVFLVLISLEYDSTKPFWPIRITEDSGNTRLNNQSSRGLKARVLVSHPFTHRTKVCLVQVVLVLTWLWHGLPKQIQRFERTVFWIAYSNTESSTYVIMHMNLHTHTRTHARTHMHACIYACTQVHVCTYTSTLWHSQVRQTQAFEAEKGLL